jgi:hypothetical protein
MANPPPHGFEHGFFCVHGDTVQWDTDIVPPSPVHGLVLHSLTRCNSLGQLPPEDDRLVTFRVWTEYPKPHGLEQAPGLHSETVQEAAGEAAVGAAAVAFTNRNR